MHRYRQTSVLFISAAIAGFYAASLIGRGSRRRSLPLLLQSFIRAPEQTEIEQVSLAQHPCYLITLPHTVLDDKGGASVLVLLENGRPLPRPHTGTVAEIKRHGGGRYLHVDRRIYFSPSDNADIASSPRRYTLMETLTLDPKKIKALFELNRRRSSFDNVGLWLLAKLQVYLSDWLQVGNAAAVGATAMTMQQVVLDLQAFSFESVRAEQIDLCWSVGETWNRLTVTATGLGVSGSPDSGELRLVLGFTAAGELRLEKAMLRWGDLRLCDGRLEWGDGRLDSGKIAFAALAPLRTVLVQACGGEEAYRSWLPGFIAAIGDRTLPFGYAELPPEQQHRLIGALLPDATADGLTLTLTRRGNAMAVTCTSS